MNKEIADDVARALKMMNDAASAGGNFALEQAPLAAQELVRYTFWESLVFELMLATILVFLCRTGFRWACKYADESDGVAFVVLGGGFVPLVILITLNTDKFIKAATAPRLVILDYVKDMVK